MFWILLLAFTVLPALELFLLIKLGAWLGAATTVLVVLCTGVVGAWMAKREGIAVLRQLTTELQGGLPPGSRLVEGALVVAGGLLLVTPGVLTDLFGFLFILPPTRRFLAPLLLAFLVRRFPIRPIGAPVDADHVPPVQGVGRAPGLKTPSTPFDHPVS